VKPMAKLRQQHKEIQDTIEEIQGLAVPKAIAENAEILISKTLSLKHSLDEHLLVEDEFIYPALKKYHKGEINYLAHLFAIELGGIKTAFSEYLNKWRTADIIRGSKESYFYETRAMFGALQHRIARENSELFPIMEVRVSERRNT